jgi:hypothetical protein
MVTALFRPGPSLEASVQRGYRRQRRTSLSSSHRAGCMCAHKCADEDMHTGTCNANTHRHTCPCMHGCTHTHNTHAHYTCIHMYVWITVCVHKPICLCIHTCVHCVCTCVGTHKCMHIYENIHAYARVCIYIHTCACLHVWAQACVLTHIYIHVCTHAYTYTHTHMHTISKEVFTNTGKALGHAGRSRAHGRTAGL